MYPWQQQQWQTWQQARTQQRLHHAHLLLGPAGTGKAGFATSFAHALLCESPRADQQACGDCAACHLLAAGTHPDFSHLAPQPPKDSKSINPVMSIRIDRVRELIDRLNTTSQLGAYRIAVIESADAMNQAAANSLLKTLEEPGSNTLLLLTTSAPHRLPITIRSRCQQTVFPLPPEKQALAWLERQGVAQASVSLKLQHGAPLKVIAAAEGEEASTMLSQALLSRLGNKQSSLAHADKLAKLPRSACLALMLDWVTDLVQVKAGYKGELINESQRPALTSLAPEVDWQRLYALYDELGRLLRYDAIALNNQLLWENLLISWDKL